MTPTIKEFYANKEIFITGGTGFMGKVLIEKLLRCCSDLKCIYVLIRSKKGKTADERLDVLRESQLFDRLRNENPKAMEKMQAVDGDVSSLGLGLSETDLKRMENVNVIFHVAASVRFDDSLKDAILMNLRGTREVLVFGEKLKNLKICVHVSTTYCNPNTKTVEEKLYPAPADWRAAIKMAENMDDEVLNILQEKYLNYHPNTYTFTKGLSEQVVNDFRHKVPVVIYRPSIVISSIEEPVPGWIDNFNGPVGLLVACGIGIMRTTYANPKTISDYTPCDVAIRGLIVVGWKHAVVENSLNTKEVCIYNCSTSKVRYMTMGDMVDLGRELAFEYPFNRVIWTPGGNITNSRFLNYIKVIVFHIFPAFIFDTILKFTNKKAFLVKLQRRIYSANMALEYFILNQWEFKNDNFWNLNKEVLASDYLVFGTDMYITYDLRLYFAASTLGCRRYLFNEKDEDLPKARTNFLRMYYLDKVVKVILFCLVFYFILINYGHRFSLIQKICNK